MSKYNFDSVVDRNGTSCIKYDFGMQRKGRIDLLPMWIADMDFKLPKVILDDLHQRIEHGIFGYAGLDETYVECINQWFQKHHGYSIQKEWLTVSCGIVYGLSVAVKAFSKPGEAVMITQPVYYPFREVIEDNGRKFINSQLHYENGRYTMDYEDIEKRILENDVKAFILCNPHNPVGRVWSREELEKLADICLRHHVILMSDEIHCDFVYSGHQFTSLMTMGEKYKDMIVVFTSPSKTFNVAGLQSGHSIIPNETLRNLYRRANSASGYSRGNIMSMCAVRSVYTKGDEWHAECLDYIAENLNYFRTFMKENFSKAVFVEPEGTYLVWVDFSGYGYSDEELEHLIVEEAKLWLDSGKIFGPATAQFERFNIACPRCVVEQALNQLKNAIEQHKKW